MSHLPDDPSAPATTSNDPTASPKEDVRRRAVVAGIAGAAALAALPALAGKGGGDSGGEAASSGGGDKRSTGSSRMPVVYIPHGGGPWPFVEIGMAPSEKDAMLAYLRALRQVPKEKPRALLVISAHWEMAVPTVMTAARPPLYFDYYGFPPASYELTWPAAGDPKLAARVRDLLRQAGIESGVDAERGFDHGTFIPLKVTYPEADVPTVQLSLKKGLDPAAHLALGRALAPLRDEGVFIVASGMSFHNMRAFGNPAARSVSETFDRWLRETVELPQEARDARLVEWTKAPEARQVHPREEHLLPLMVAAGAAGADRGVAAWSGRTWNVAISAAHFG